jgi:hypothetical protein
MVPLRLLVAIVALFVALPVGAKVVTDWQTGCQIVVPDEWRTSFTASGFPGFGARSYNTKDLTSVDFSVDDQITKEPLTEQTAWVQNFVTSVGSQDFVVIDRSHRTVNDHEFLVLTISGKKAPGTKLRTAWFTVVKGHICQIMLSIEKSNPDKSDVLNGIIQSFIITDHVLPHSPVLDAQGQQDEFLKNNPFNFYGKVLDENGQPVPGATVKFLIGGELNSTKGESERDLQSGADGLFSLEGIHAMDVLVTAAKDGYYTLPEKHPGAWWWMERGFKPGTMPTKDQPAIFSLKKKGPTEPLIILKTNGSVNVPPDGTTVEYNLERNRVVKGQPGTFNVQLWVDAHDPKSNQPYHWKYRITVPGGGLQPILDEYDFSAPSLGYQEFIENEMAPGISGWNDSREQKYFVKLADGKYARIRFEVRALGDFFIEDGYLNPSGSQNLEFDPTKRIKPGP